MTDTVNTMKTIVAEDKVVSKKKDIILFSPVIREINKEAMFMEFDRAQARWDVIQNHFTKALLDYDVEKAKAYKELLTNVKWLLESTKMDKKFK